MRISGTLVDRAGRRMAMVGLGALAVVAILAGAVGNLVTLFVVMVLLGVSTGASDVVINSVAALYETTTGKPVMGFAHAMFSAGVVVFSVLTAIARHAGAVPLEIFVIPAVLCALSGVALGVAWQGSATMHSHAEHAAPASRRRLLVLGAVCGLAFLIEDAQQSWSAIHLEQAIGAVAATAALGPAVLGLSMVVSRMSAHVLTGWLGARLLVVTGAAVAASGCIVVAVAPNVAVDMMGIALCGLGIGACAPVVFSLTGREASPARRAAALSTVSTTAYTGFLAGPPIVGFIGQAAGLRSAFVAVAAIAVAMAALAAVALGSHNA
jgi:MFS family permease